MQIRWLEEAQYYNDCALKGVSAILYKSTIVHSGDLCSQTGGGLSWEGSHPTPKVYKRVPTNQRAGVGVLRQLRTWELAVRPLLQVEVWHQPNLKEDIRGGYMQGKREQSHNWSSAAFIAHDNPVDLPYLQKVWEVAC